MGKSDYTGTSSSKQGNRKLTQNSQQVRSIPIRKDDEGKRSIWH